MIKSGCIIFAVVISVSLFSSIPQANAGNCGGICLSSEYKLCRAAKNGDEKKVRRLLSQGVNTEARVHSTYGDGYYLMGNTPLILGVRGGYAGIARILIDFGANVNAASQYSLISRFDYIKTGKTSLHYASAQGNGEIVGLLLDNGANIDARDSDGNTPLHDAVYNGQLELVKMLLHRGADCKIQNRSHLTAKNVAWRRAKDHGDWKLFKLLRDCEEGIDDD